jgi:hypothetical protein
MTNEQKRIKAKCEDSITKIIDQLLTEAEQARAAIVELPHIGEDGEKVIHRDNNHMRNIIISRVAAVRHLVLALTTDEQEVMARKRLSPFKHYY